MENSVCIQKDYDINGFKVRFYFQGTRENKQNIDDFTKIIENWLLNVKTFQDFEVFSMNIKNLFRHFTNKEIKIAFITKEEEKWGISFQNDHLVYLRNKNLLYTCIDGKISLNCDFVLGNNSPSKEISLISEEIRPLEFGPLLVCDDEKKLYQLYSLFYGQTPDVTRINFPSQVQLMFFILREICNLNILHDYNFLPQNDAISSEVLSVLIKKFQAFGYFEKEEVEIELDEKLKTIVSKVGLIVRSSMNINDFEQINHLLSYLYYAKSPKIYSDDNPKYKKIMEVGPKKYVKSILDEIGKLNIN